MSRSRTKAKQTKAKKKPKKKEPGKGVHWSKEEVDTLMVLVEKDMSVADIAQNLGRPKKSVENKIYRERRKQEKNASKILRKEHPKKTAVQETQVLHVESAVEDTVPTSKLKAFWLWLLGIKGR
mgnify:CR=1 FL=1